MIHNNKNVQDTHATKTIVQNIAGQVQMKEVMADKTPSRYALKSMMAGFTFNCYSVYVSNQNPICFNTY